MLEVWPLGDWEEGRNKEKCGLSLSLSFFNWALPCSWGKKMERHRSWKHFDVTFSDELTHMQKTAVGFYNSFYSTSTYVPCLYYVILHLLRYAALSFDLHY